MNARVNFRNLFRAGLLAMALCGANHAQASVVVAGTRVIYNQKDAEVTLKLTNAGQSPALVQAWIDTGDAKAAPSTIDVPFTVTPPVSRIDPGKGQTLRIIRTGNPKVQDHESVYWLNVLEIPPKNAGAAADSNALQLAFRTRIKLFFRPDGLKGNVEEATRQVTWRLTTLNGRPAVEAHNPSNYDVSFASFSVTGSAGTVTFDDGGMVRPGETATFSSKGALSGGPSAKVSYHAINDYGGAIDGEAPLK